MGVSLCNNHKKYLGLPILVGRNRHHSFETLKDKVWARVNNLKNTFLSQGGKEVSVKVVVQAIPTYAMSVFIIPRRTCKAITSLMSAFWWGHMQNKSSIHWKKWKHLGNTKSLGSLGFQDLKAFNRVLLAKQIWRLMKNPDSLVCQILKSKYFSFSKVMEAKLGHNPFFIWWSFRESLLLVREWMLRRIGDRHKIHI